MSDLKQLIAKHERGGPRYTSYPTAPYFSTDADKSKLADAALRRPSPLSLYIHIPFCRSHCLFCGCSSWVCQKQEEVDDYLNLLSKELSNWQKAGLGKRKLGQIHLGGGTPNFLSVEQTKRLGSIINENFEFADSCEFSVEFDPRTLTKEKVDAWVEMGLNRASVGIQDTNPQIQKLVNRIQPHDMNLQTFEWLNAAGIDKINIDLIYGLPMQTHESFAKTLEEISNLKATRIALFGYAHVPWVKAEQKVLEQYHIPSGEEKVELFLDAKEFLENRGFEFIGLDHFAKPDDPLIVARKNGRLHRTFQGYTTHAELEGFGLGLTSISQTRLTYRQNFKNMQTYKNSVLAGGLPIERGIILDGEDLLRRGIIMDIMCSLKVYFNRYGVDFKAKFADVFPSLTEMQSDGLIKIHDDFFEVTALGRIFLRNIAMLFDGRLGDNAPRYSKTL